MTRKIQALIFRTSFIFGILALCTNLLGQDGANPVDIAVRFNTDVPPEVKINQVFGIQAEVYLEANSSTIPAGEIVVADAYLIDPSGLIIQEHSQEWNGFNEQSDGMLENTAVDDSLLFQVPWSQASKWSASARWTVSVRLTASSIESNMTNNLIDQSFSLLIPDLQNVVTEVTATDPINGGQTTSYTPNTNYTVSGTITNLGSVITQPSVHVAVRARLHKLNPISPGQYDLGEVIDEESIVFPETDDPLLYLPAGGSYNYKIENLFLPADAEGEYVVVVEVNPADIVGGRIMFEQDYTNNWDAHPATPTDTDGDGQVDYYSFPFIDVRPNEANATSFPELEFVPNSYKGETGTFRGLEPAFISFAIRNNGQRPVSGSDEISARVLLSKDLQADSSDFVLREFNLGGGGIGQGMLAGETINLTWFQQLPDNFEGDYYLIVEIVNLSSTTLYYADQTPTFTLTSEDKGSTDLVLTNSGAAERPSTSEDGRYVVYEKTETHSNGQAYQQIYLLDMQSPSMNPVLISKSYSDITGQLPANNSSLRPRISLDGSTIVFHSRASDLVPGDSNGKEDIFLYRIATNTLLRAVNENDQQLNGRSLYADVNGDGSRVVFESDATNADLNSSRNTGGKEIYLWDLGESAGGTITALTKGNGNSYNPSIDESGMRIVFDSFSTDLLADEKYIVGDEGEVFSGQTGIDNSFTTNGLRHVYALDLEPESRESADKAQIYLVNLNYNFQEAEGGASMNPRISGNGQRIVFESKSQNLITGAGIAKVVVTEGGAGYEGSPTIEIIDEVGEDDLNASGAPGTGVVFAMREDGINALQEIKSDAILIINPGSGYVNPRVRIIPDPSYPEPLLEAKATAYLANPDGDIYFVDWNDLDGTTFGEGDIPSFSKRVSEAVKTQTGGNFGSREPDISKDGSKIVYSTKSSNLLPDEFGRDDGATFYNSNFLLPTAQAILVGPIQEIEIANNGSGYQSGFFNIEDLSGAGFGAQASFEVDQRGRIVSITIINPGQNYRLETTRVTVAEPLGGSGFVAGELRFPPTQGLGETRTGGGRIFKVEMTDYGLGYKITDDGTGSFADLIQFEGDGADLNSDGFPDGRINPDRVHSKDGSLFLEQKFNVEVISLGADLMSTSLTVSDKNSSLEPLTIEFDDTSGSSLNSRTINITGLSLDEVRDALVDEIVDYLNIPSANKISSTANILKGSIIDENATNGTSFTFSALSGKFTSSNPSAIKVTEQSNMLVMGSGYTIVTPVVNQVPSIFGLSEVESNPSYELTSGVGRMTLLAKEDQDSDDIYLYDIDLGTNSRISTSSFGTPAAYIPNEEGTLPSPPSNRFASISGNGRFVFFSSDSWGSEGLAFLESNQLPKALTSGRNIYIRDLKTAEVSEPSATLRMLFPNAESNNQFAPASSVPVIADLNTTQSYSRVAMILNQVEIGNMDEFGGGGVNNFFQSGRFTSSISDLSSGEYSLQLVAYGMQGEILATSSIRRFIISEFEGSLPPMVTLSDPSGFDSVTSTSVIPLSATGQDPDGALVGIKYYLDGVLHKSINRYEGLAELDQAYSTLLDINSTLEDGEVKGFRTVFVTAEDNSGNIIASEVYSISFTKGSEERPQISFITGPVGFTIEPDDIQFEIENNQSIGPLQTISLRNGLDAVGNDLITARLEIVSDNISASGADFKPIIDLNSSSPNYGSLVGFERNEDFGGSGYSPSDDITIKVVPTTRAINPGTPASINYSVGAAYEKGGVLYRTDSATVATYLDGEKRLGNGYATAPSLRFRPDGGAGLLPLIDVEAPTTSIQDFQWSRELLAFDPQYDAYVEGGFVQSPLFFSIEANSSSEKIESVSLIIDGVFDQDLVETEDVNGSYHFSWIPQEAKLHTLGAIVRDVAGNVVSTPESTFYVENYSDAGLAISLRGENNYSIESNGFLTLAADATSANEVVEVEFYIDNQSVGVAFGTGGSSFQTVVPLENYNFSQGEHQLTMVARDKSGNLMGTFPRTRTNLRTRMNRSIFILPPITKNKPEVILNAPTDQTVVPLGSSLRLSASASDPNGDIKGIQFYVDDEVLSSWSGTLEFNNSLPADGTLLILEDGTDKPAVTYEFDTDYQATGGGSPDAIPTSPSNFDTIVVSGDYTFTKSLNYHIEIDRNGSSADTFRWSKDGGKTFVQEKILITGAAQELSHGLAITFSKTNGYALGDSWSIHAEPQNIIVDLTSAQMASNSLLMARNSLQRVIEQSISNEQLSLRTTAGSDSKSIHLYQTFASPITSLPSATGNSLSALDSNLTFTSNTEEFIYAQTRDGKLDQPFGMTWVPTKTGDYVIFAAVEDSNGSQTSSIPVLVQVIQGIGQVPEIFLQDTEKELSFEGSPVPVTLNADAEDADGTIAEVMFFSNGVQVGSDVSRPFSVSFEINATGHYEVYAVARDNSGNLVTSNVRRIIADDSGEGAVQPLVLTASSAYIGGVGEISATYTSLSGVYDSNIRALVYIDGSYAGDADLLPRTPPGVGEEDPGQSFTYDLPARGAGVKEVEIVIINDQETTRASSQLFFSESVLTDDLAFINMLYDGLFKRLPEGFENGQFYGRLEDGTLTREQAIEEISRRAEFIKARNMLLVHKTLFGEWRDLGTILSEIDPTFVLDSNDPTTIASYATRPDDAETDDPSATLVGMNQVVRGVIETPSDIDTFRIASLGPNQNGLLTVTLEAGHPGVALNTRGPSRNLVAINFLTDESVEISQISDFHPAGEGYGTSGIVQRTYDLRGFTGSTDWEFYLRVEGNPLQTGPYALIFENRPVLVAEETENFFQNLGQVPSAIMDYNFESTIGYLTSKFEYFNQYGTIGTHDPEKLFTRLFKNKYEQMPSPRQIVRATDLIADVNRTQFEFTHQFILENKVITQGAYNYTQTESNSSFASLAIPNVPHDIAAFADTALLYLALLDQAPSNAEVAKISLTPEYNLRPITERARMIMEMPAFAARYGLAMPEVDLPNLKNGRTYSAGKNVLIDAASLGADNLAGTVDDGHIREIKVLFNGKDLSTNVTADGFYYEFQIPSLPDGQYLVEVIAEDKNGLTSRAQRNIFLGTLTETVALISPAVDEILDIDEEVDFQFTLSDPTYSAYLEVNGRIPWIGNIQFSGEDLPDDESNLTIKDGMGGEVTFEFDTDFTTSSTQTDAAEKMYVEGTDSLSAFTSNYLGTEYREYLIEIDGDGTGPNGNDTFRWSIDGGAHFNNSAIEINASTPSKLSAGIEVDFDSNTSYSLGDRWRIKAYPTNEIVAVGRYGSFADRLATTRQNLVDAINRANNEGKLAIRAKRSEVESTSSGWFDSLNQNKYGIGLRRVGNFPIREKLSVDTLVTSFGATTLSKSDWLNSPFKSHAITSSPATLSLNLSKMGFTQPLLEARVVAFDDQNNTIYSEPRDFVLRDPSRLSIELIDPIGRKASIRLKSSASGALTDSDFEILDGGAGYTAKTAQLSIISELGKGAMLRANVNEAGEVSGVEVLSAGNEDYSASDLVLVSAPLQYKVGESISLSAKVRDPLSELDRVAFYANGVELDLNFSTIENGIYTTSYDFGDESTQFISSRALFGDDRDRGPNIIAQDEWMNGPGISGDRTNYWGWRRHWAEQHFHRPGYVFPEWFIQDQDYWALPPPWLSLPYQPGALPVFVTPDYEEEAISIISSSKLYLGSVELVSFTFRSEDREYDSSLSASVFVDGQFAGNATKLDYDTPQFWEQDPGHQFEFALPVHTTGVKEVEIFISNGGDSFSAYTTVQVEESPLTDHFKFLNYLWSGLYDRGLFSFELSEFSEDFESGILSHEALIDKLRDRQEFIKARNMLIGQKTIDGEWHKISDVLLNIAPTEIVESGLAREDDGEDFDDATTVKMNDFIRASLNAESDRDWFKIQSLGKEKNGELTVTYKTIGETAFVVGGSWDYARSLVARGPGGATGQKLIVPKDIDEPGNDRLVVQWDLSAEEIDEDWLIYIPPVQYRFGAGGRTELGDYTITLSNPEALKYENANPNYDSPVHEFIIQNSLEYLSKQANYFDKYGALNTHNPEEFYTRIFTNKYEQEPNAWQINQGLKTYTDLNRTQLNYLEFFALSNDLRTIGGRNYSSYIEEGNATFDSTFTSYLNAAIVDAPIPIIDFAETALVYSALMGFAPSNAEVARLTLTSDYQIRPIKKRVKMILNNGSFGAALGIYRPIVEFIDISNGNTYDAGTSHPVVIHASRLGADNQAGTLDDQSIPKVELFVNGISVASKDYNESNEYKFNLDPDLPIGEYTLEAVVRDVGGNAVRTERKIYLTGSTEQEVLLTSPRPGTILNSEGVEKFEYETDRNVTAYLEVDGQVNWNGFLSFDKIVLPDDNSTFTLHDGTAREPVVFEFDQDGLAEGVIEGPAVIRRFGAGNLDLVGGGVYPYSEVREYIVEIDGIQCSPNGHDTFRWSRAGSDEINASGVEIMADTNILLEDGITIRFDNNVSYAFGDAWQITTRGKNEVVKVTKEGSIKDRLLGTKRNLLAAINRVHRSDRLAIYAEDPWEDLYDRSTPLNLQSELAVSLVYDGSYPIVTDLDASKFDVDEGANLIALEHISAAQAEGSSGELTYDFSRHHIEGKAVRVRIITIDDDGNFGYSVPWVFETDPKDGPSLRIVSPKGRPATLRINEIGDGGELVSVEVIDQGEGYESQDLILNIHTSSGRGGVLRAKVNGNGGIENVEVVNSGTGYNIYDSVVAPASYLYSVGDTLELKAVAVDPHNEIENVRFYVNGQLIDGNVSKSGNEYSTPFSFEDENAAFFSVQYSKAGEKAGGDLIHKWLPAYNLQKFYQAEYNSPIWMWGDLDYWEYPGPWVNNPLPGSGLLVEHKKTYKQLEILQQGTGVIGSDVVLHATYRSPTRDYSDDIYASVYIDDQFAGYATLQEYEQPEFWEDDPGYVFEFSYPANLPGVQQIEIYVTNGDESSTAYAAALIEESALTDHYEFLTDLWNGLFGRSPEDFEYERYFTRLRDGNLTRTKIFEELRQLDEFSKACDMLLSNKTLLGNWGELGIVLEDIDPLQKFRDEIASGTPIDSLVPAELRPDDPDFLSGATVVSMNQVVNASINDFGDVDYFRIDSIGPGQDGFLEVEVTNDVNDAVGDMDLLVTYPDAPFPIDLENFDLGTTLTYEAADLDALTRPNPTYYIVVYGSELYTGSYSLVIKNTKVFNYQEIEDYFRNLNKIDSPVMDFDIVGHLKFKGDQMEFKNRFGEFGENSPSSFFTMIFTNKYDQAPNPSQANRGVELLKQYEDLDGNESPQLMFLHDFALENNIITTGGYNYTTSEAQLAIPNVPIDTAAFAETALIYSALVGQAPSNAEVAKLTLDPYFEVRHISERARLIMEMPEYSARYEVSTPEVTVLNLENGDILADEQSIVVEVFDYGLDGLPGSLDDLEISHVTLLLNGTPFQTLDGNKSTIEYVFDLSSGLPSGEYKLEVVAENIRGQQGRSFNQVFVGSDKTNISLSSPAYGSVLKKGEPIEVGYALNAGLGGRRFLEVNGDIRWSGVFLLEDYLFTDGSTISLVDGTGRDSVSFEMDSNDSFSSYTIESTPIRKLGDGNLSVHANYVGPAEGIEILVSIDGVENDTGSSFSFSWREMGYFENEDNETGIQIVTDANYSLGYGLALIFDTNASFEFGDTWRIKVEPKYIGNLAYSDDGTEKFVFESTICRAEIESDGTYEERTAITKRNLIHSINLANADGLTAMHAYDPVSDAELSGMLPFDMPADRAIILRHDGSYPITNSVEVLGLDKDDVQDLFPLITASSGTSLTLSNWDGWEMRDGLIEFRVVLVDALGNISYSDKRTYPLVDPTRGYVELIGPLGTSYEPGRLPTVHFAESFSGPSSLPTSASGIKILDGGSGYRWFDQQEPGFQIVSSTGYAGSLRIQSVGSTVGSVYSVYADSGSTGYGYMETDVIVPNPPALFDKNQNIDVAARLYDPYEEYARVAFYLNGVELNSSSVQDRSGGRYGMTFSSDSAGDKFLTVRALYGDSRDMGPATAQPFGHFGVKQDTYGGKDHWGWKKSWLQQHYSTGQEFLPTWFGELHDHWIHPKKWAYQPIWDGAAPIRIENKDIYESVSITINSNSPALLVNELLHSQSTEIYVTADWAQGNVPFTEVHLYGNDQQIAQLDVANNNPFSNRLQWTFEWFVNFKQFKDDFGLVDLKVVGITEEGRQITSSVKRVYIRELSLTDPKSTIAMFWMDITGEILNPARLEEILGLVNTSSIQSIIDSIVDYINQGEYQYMADLISAYQALYGEYHSSSATFYGHYNLWSEQIRNNRSVGLLAYITDQISSNKYANKYGVIPNDKPYFFGTVEGINFNNRRDFVVRHWLNKYGTQPTVMQYMSGAKKMWDYAGGQQAFPAAATNYTLNRMAAADFVFNLTTEPTVKYGITGSITQPYISGMGSNTNRSLFLDRAKQYALGNAGSFANVFEDVMQASESTSQKMVEEVAEDPALIRRFNLLWEDSTSLAFDYWKYEEWFGHFMDEKYPWIYHVDLGWLYSHGTSQRNIWFYSETMGWFWTNREIFTDHPNLDADNQRFIYRVRPSATGGWEGSWSLVTLPTSDGGSSVIELYDYGYDPF